MSLKPAAPLGGRVVNAAGEPVEGAFVIPYQFSLMPDDELPHAPTAVVRERTDAQGQFQFTRLWPGKWKLFVLAEGYAPAVTEYIRHKTDDALIQLTPPVQMAGAVVHAETGEPVPGVHFYVAREGCRRDKHEVTSDADGAFQLDGLAQAQYRVLMDDVAMIAAQPDPSFLAGEKHIEIPVRQGGIVTGRVFDAETNEPIPSAEVYVSHSGVVEVDSLGNFIAMGLPPAQLHVSLQEAPPGYALTDKVGSHRITLAAGAEVHLDFPLRRGVELSGIVRDADGSPVAGADVTIHGSSPDSWHVREETGADGRFRTSSVLPESTASIRAVKDNAHSRIQQNVKVPQEGINNVALTLDLIADASLRGRLSNSVQAGMIRTEDLDVVLVPVDPALPARQRGVDLAGRFIFDEVVPGEYQVQLQSTGGMFWQCNAGRITLKPGEQAEGFEAGCGDEDGLKLAGRVVNERQQAVSGALVYVSGTGIPPARTDAEGRFAIAGLKNELVTLIARHDDYKTFAAAGLAVAEDLEIVLGPRSTVSGRVVDAATGAPVKSFEIGASDAVWSQGYWSSGNAGAKSVTDVNGEFTLEKVDPSAHLKLYARAPGYAPAETPIDVPPDTHLRDVKIALAHGRQLEGRVVDGSGAPVVGARVFLGRIQTQPEYQQAAAMADADGRFILEDVPDEAVELSAWSPGYAAIATTAKPSEGPVELVLGRGGRVEGAVFVDGDPARFYSVMYEDAAHNLQHVQMGDISAGLDGTFVMENVPPGKINLRVAQLEKSEEMPNAWDYVRTQQWPVVVEEGKTTPVVVEFLTGYGNYDGIVYLDGEPAQGYEAVLTIDGQQFETTGEADGMFRFVTVPEGEGELTIRLNDLPLSKELTVIVGRNPNSAHVNFVSDEVNWNKPEGMQ